MVVKALTTLALVDSNKKITVNVYAIVYSLDAVLLQEGKPVEYAVKVLTCIHCLYTQVTKDMMVSQFG